ncbi:MAG: hypothetical protein PHD04_00885 [Candidatus Pacebacteria bacterium]|nr:hypothetical protein [Candidatus Paceibacterota bacterium]
MEQFYPKTNLSGWLGKASRIWQKLFVQTVVLPEQAAPSGNPETNTGWLYVKDNGGESALYYESDAGNVTQIGATSTAFDDIGDPDGAGSIAFGTNAQTITSAKTDGDMLTISGIGNFGDVSVLKVEQKTGNPTDGTVLEVVSADAQCDALIVTSNGTDCIAVTGAGVVNVNGGAGSITFTDFSVSNDGVITISPDNSPAACIVVDPSAAATTGIDCSEANLVNAIDCGANVITGTTASIDFTNFKVATDGDVTAVDGTFSGNVSVTGTFQQDAITAKTAATTITVDGKGAGGVTLGGTSTGAVTLGGGAVLVNLPTNVDMTVSGGTLSVTDTANADCVTITNNTMTTADLVTLNATGTRTSDNVIEIVDGATTATTIGITANTQTSGGGILYTNSGAGLTGDAIRLAVTDGAGFTGNYLNCYDGAASDLKIARYGATTIAGNAAADMLTITAGNVQVDNGKIELDTTQDIGSYVKRNNATGTGAVFTVQEQHATGGTALAVDSDATDGNDALVVTHDGTGSGIKVTGTAATSTQANFIGPASQTTSIVKVDGSTGSWIGAPATGMIHATSDGALVADAALIRIASVGNISAANDGACLEVLETGAAQATSYAVKIDSTNNEALHVATGKALFDEEATFTGGINVDAGVDIDMATNATVVNVTAAAGDFAAGDSAVTIYGSAAGGQTNDSYLLRLARKADGDAQDSFILCQDNSTGAAANGDQKLKVGTNGTITMGAGATGTGGAFIGSFENLTIANAGTAASIVQLITFIATDGNGDEDNVTLADGTVGQLKIFASKTEGAGADTWKITPANMNGGTKISFDGVVGDGATLVFDGTKWTCISTNGGTIS